MSHTPHTPRGQCSRGGGAPPTLGVPGQHRGAKGHAVDARCRLPARPAAKPQSQPAQLSKLRELCKACRVVLISFTRLTYKQKV